MKRNVIVLFFLMLLTAAFSDTIIFKDGNSITGEVLKETDDSVIILSPLGTMTISKTEIERVIIDKQQVSKKSGSNNHNVNIVTRDVYKYDPDFKQSRRMFGLALAFFIPGNVLFFGTIAFGTAPIVDYYSSGRYKGSSDDYYRTSDDLLPGATYASLLLTGILLNFVSIPFFVSSHRFQQSFKKRHEMSLISGFDGNNLALGLKFSI